jgi:hypothetical protein
MDWTTQFLPILRTHDLLGIVYGLDTSKQVLSTLATKFANDSRSRIANLKRQLLSLHQCSLTYLEYIQSAKVWFDQLVAIGKPVLDEDLISFLLNGLNPSFNTFVTTVSLLTKENLLDDFQDELINHEM